MIEIYQWNLAGKSRFVEWYISLDSFLSHYYEDLIKSSIGYRPSDVMSRNHLSEPVYAKIVFIDGRSVTPDYLIGAMRNFELRRKSARSKLNKKRLHDRSHRKCKWSGYRNPKTLAESRSHGTIERGEPVNRASRNYTNLPNAWDDLKRKNDRSWKRHRKTQWKYND